MFSTTMKTLAFATAVSATGISITPHAQYSSSIGVLGCHINTNRVAYWPMEPSCDSVCVKVSSNGRSVNLLQIDTSGGAYDISYDAWNYLNVGQSAAENPTTGGGIDAEYEFVDMSQCADLIQTDDGKLPLMAANSIGYYVGCSGSPMGDKCSLYNIANSACTMGYDETCTLDLAVSNQPSCPHTLGSQNPLSGHEVMNIDYGTGKQSVAQ